MSRETDNPPPNPRGWGSEGEGAARPGAPQSEEKQTETTMTTRARINIPGSRPIPPIVVRETVDEATARGVAGPAPAPAPTPGTKPTPAGGSGDGKKTSSWFEPRKPPRVGPGDAGAPAPGPGPATGATPTVGRNAEGAPFPGVAPAPGQRPAARPESDRASFPGMVPGPATGATPIVGRDAEGAPFPGVGPGPATAPMPPVGATDTAPFPVVGAPASDGPGTGAFPGARRGDTPPAGVPGLSAPPSPTETPAAGIPGLGRSGPSWFQPTDTPPDGTERFAGPAAGSPAGGPTGPTTGPGSGSMPIAPPPGEEPAATTMDLGGPFPPAPPLNHPEPAAVGEGLAVPPPGPDPALAEDDEPTSTPAPAPASAGGRKRRARTRLLVVGVVGLAVVAYGAGLLLNSDDVPKGTSVLGVDIGGTTSQEAVNRLDAALDQANSDPLTLLVGGEEIELKPSVAGLVIDTETTVRELSGQDYSPVTVIGSLFGAARTEDAVFSVDRAKLTTALEDIASQAAGDGAPVEGTVTFENGEAIGSPGQSGNTIDIEAAADAVESAFRDRAATGRDPAVELPVTTQDPLVDEAEVQRAMEEFAEPAMSGLVYLIAAGTELPFSPETLSGLLTMEPSEDGTLQPVLDTEGLAAAYGSTFDGIMIDAGAGLVEMTPEHAAAAMIPVLRETATTDYGEGRREAIVEGAVWP
ncbi:peptidoglycan binding domain-containing protein [Streptomyces sp. B6B3]|uniref:peptidoglycan binding domain-containing protein n=1 Tax=Streptomyces sp. B6B3 TaxID=3153570 RepID=UPI00325CEFE1